MRHLPTPQRLLTRALLLLALLPAATACFVEVPEAPECVSDGSALPGDMTQTNRCCDLSPGGEQDPDSTCATYYADQMGVPGDLASRHATCAPLPDTERNGVCQIDTSALAFACLNDSACADAKYNKCIYNTSEICTKIAGVPNTSACARCAECAPDTVAQDCAEEGAEVCEVSGGASFGICRPCDPAAAEDECPPDAQGTRRTCQLIDGAPRCLAAPLKLQGEPCERGDECAAGLNCFEREGGAKTCDTPCSLARQNLPEVCGELLCACVTEGGTPGACTPGLSQQDQGCFPCVEGSANLAERCTDSELYQCTEGRCVAR